MREEKKHWVIQKLFFCTREKDIDALFEKENIMNTIEKIQLLRECMGVIKTFDGTEKVSIAEEYEFEKAAFVEGTWRLLN